MRGITSKIKLTAMASSIIQMVIFMRENGLTIRHMGKESTFTLTELSIMEIGSKMSNMDGVKSSGPMVRSTKDNMRRAESMGGES